MHSSQGFENLGSKTLDGFKWPLERGLPHDWTFLPMLSSSQTHEDGAVDTMNTSNKNQTSLFRFLCLVLC